MKTLLCIVSVFALGVIQLPADILSGPVYNPQTTHTYYLLASAPWTVSEAAAVALGGHLVTVNDAAENNWLTATFSNFGGNTGRFGPG